MSNTQVDQLWAVIEEFPDYSVSNWGLIFSHKRRRVISTSRNNFGDIRVGLSNDYGRRTLSVVVLVAQAFVPTVDALSDTVVQLDGDKRNVAADNLVWRPRSFAWKYVHQLRVPIPLYCANLAVVNCNTGAEYPSIHIAAMAEGLLFKDIWRSTHSGTRCYPHGHTFEVIERV